MQSQDILTITPLRDHALKSNHTESFSMEDTNNAVVNSPRKILPESSRRLAK